MRLIKKNQDGKTFETSTPGFKILYRNKNSIAGDNAENPKELIYLITGIAEITVDNKIWKSKAPAEIKIPANTYHKIKALTNITFVLFEN